MPCQAMAPSHVHHVEMFLQECFWSSRSEAPLVTPTCGKADCAFGQDAAAVLKCPFASSGKFRPAPAAACDVGEEEVLPSLAVI